MAKGDPGGGVCFVCVEIVSFGSVSHGKDVIGEHGGFVPRRGERNVQADLGLVGKGFDPGESVRVGPDGVEDAGEVWEEDEFWNAPYFLMY